MEMRDRGSDGLQMLRWPLHLLRLRSSMPGFRPVVATTVVMLVVLRVEGMVLLLFLWWNTRTRFLLSANDEAAGSPSLAVFQGVFFDGLCCGRGGVVVGVAVCPRLGEVLRSPTGRLWCVSVVVDFLLHVVAAVVLLLCVVVAVGVLRSPTGRLWGVAVAVVCLRQRQATRGSLTNSIVLSTTILQSSLAGHVRLLLTRRSTKPKEASPKGGGRPCRRPR